MTSTVETTNLEPVVVPPGEGRNGPITIGASELLPKLLAADTGGLLAAGILTAGPMSGPPLHIHSREDEWFYVLKGELTFQVGDKRFTAGPGTSVFAPRNVPHTWQNCTNEPVEALGLVTPPEFIECLAEMSRQELEPGERGPLLTRYGVTVLGPPLS
jgi:mannose-6-phosphate isomerase-like protein (cupin superfamily)